jgi:ceramide glucosyltransferase
VTRVEIASVVLAVWSMFVSVASWMAITRAWNYLRTSHATSVRSPLHCLVIRPCAGNEPFLQQSLESSHVLFENVVCSLVFAVADETDRALPVARAVCHTLRSRGLDVTVMVTGAKGFNQKASQLAIVTARTPMHDVVVVMDSDVDCTGLSLQKLLAPMTFNPTIAAVWVPVIEHAGNTIADRASEAVLVGSLHAFPLLSMLDPHGMVSKVVALRKEALTLVGGFSAVEQTLGEDMELARRFRTADWCVRVYPGTVKSLAVGRSWQGIVLRYARWIAVIRSQRPWLLVSYPAMFFATSLVCLVGVGLTRVSEATMMSNAVALSACVVAMGSRVAVAVCGRKIVGSPLSNSMMDVLLADVLLVCAFVTALTTRTVVWRGRKLHVASGGTVSETV